MATNYFYSDLDLTFLRKPVNSDISMKYNEQAVIRSIRNLLATNRFERLFQPEIGSTIKPVSPLSASLIEDEIGRMIDNYEPRATISQIKVSANPDSNSFAVYIAVFIGNQTSPTAINIILTRSR